MPNVKKPSYTITSGERTAGLVYTVFSLFLLPAVLQLCNRALPKPLGAPWLNFLYYSLNFISLCVILRGFLRRSLIYAGQKLLPFLGYTLAGFGLYFLSSFLVNALILKLDPSFSNMNDGAIGQQLRDNFWVMAIGTVLLVPLAEECMHRALIFGTLCKESPLAAYVVSALFFAAVHVMGYLGVVPFGTIALSFVQYLPAGLILAWCYRKSGCIFVPILIHTVINTMGLLTLR